MQVRSFAFAAALLMILVSVPIVVPEVLSDGSDGADLSGSETFRVKNIYSVEFVAEGAIPSYEKGSVYYFIVNSDNHQTFLEYIEAGGSAPISDDMSVIQKGDKVISYMFSSEFYDDGYTTILEFYNFEGTTLTGYLQLTYELDISMTIVDRFFVEGADAVIRWNTVPSTLTVYFGGENVSKQATYVDGHYETTVHIDHNGSYKLWFANDSTNSLTGDVSYSLSSYETSGSLWIAIIVLVLALLGVSVIVFVHSRPSWSMPEKKA